MALTFCPLGPILLHMKTGDAVTVNLGKRGGIQNGTVVNVLTDGRFVWVNSSNFSRTSSPANLTTRAPHDGAPSAYMRAWSAEERAGE